MICSVPVLVGSEFWPSKLEIQKGWKNVFKHFGDSNIPITFYKVQYIANDSIHICTIRYCTVYTPYIHLQQKFFRITCEYDCRCQTTPINRIESTALYNTFCTSHIFGTSSICMNPESRLRCAREVIPTASFASFPYVKIITATY